MGKFSIKDLLNLLNKYAPWDLAEDWDNVGLNVGRKDRQIKKILCALDPNPKTIQEAIDKNIDTLITHHPLLMKGIKKIDESQANLKSLALLIENKINLIALHTNLDACKNGLNDVIARNLNLKSIKPLHTNKNYPGQGAGRYGSFEKAMLWNTFLKKLAHHLTIKNLRWAGIAPKQVKKVALLTGSGASYYPLARSVNADVYITGDLKYHTALDVYSEGLCIIDAGHFGTEKHAAETLCHFLKKSKIKVPFEKAESSFDPFHLEIF